MAKHRVVSHEDWIKARQALLKKEKDLTHLREDVAEQRGALPWKKVEKKYVFDGPDGKATLADLFALSSVIPAGRNQCLL
jgi:predicted dithiol-disulfide oxidoreductase (DUF899 family)